jgi:hypothetical protein
MRWAVGVMLVVIPQLLLAQGARTSGSNSVVGTYRHFGAAHEGCAIEVGEPKADSVRVQFDCNRGAPSYHHGANDLRMPLHSGVASYQDTNSNGTCTLRFAFARDRVKVTQTGSDLACGFGAFVNIDGTYPLVSRRPPKFDLLPL